jgi:hypothetical protein
MNTLISALLWGLGAAVCFGIAAAAAERGKDTPDYWGWLWYGVRTWVVMAALLAGAWLMGWWTP